MQRRWNAVLLSLIPGVGHLYLGFPFKALVWFVLTVCSCWLLWPIAAISAWSLGKTTLQAEDLQAIRKAIENQKEG